MRRVLFDEDIPRPLRNDLPDFKIQTVVEVGWGGTKNGELLRLADQAFDVFLTADRNLSYQQNISRLRIGVVVLAIGSTKLADLRALASQITKALETVEPGQILRISGSI